MRAHHLNSTGLQLVEQPNPIPGAFEVLLNVKAVALNYRDLMIADGNYLKRSDVPSIPASDALGQVVAVGEQATRFKVGDRVVNTFFPKWLDGPVTASNTATTWGADTDGVLAEQITAHEDALVHAPAHLSDAEAATLACAGVTAWNALFPVAGLQPGSTVLMLGTGGVSIWALQIAKACALRTIITSSSDEKLDRARTLGADATINYRRTPEWQDEVLRLTQGRGADLVLEVGGEGTMARSIAATAMGGTVAVIGGVAGFGGTSINPFQLIGGAKRLAGVYVGSRRMLEDLNRLVSVAQIRPVVDRVFGFEDAAAAYQHLREGRHFGKVVVAVEPGRV